MIRPVRTDATSRSRPQPLTDAERLASKARHIVEIADKWFANGATSDSAYLTAIESAVIELDRAVRAIRARGFHTR